MSDRWMFDEPQAEAGPAFEDHYLPVPCVCGRFRLEYQRLEPKGIRVVCEKCKRDSHDGAWDFYVASKT